MTNAERTKHVRGILRTRSVGIAGAGGLGSNVAVALVRGGVGRLVLVDFDKVEEFNLTRQYYFREDIGRPKVKALKDILLRIDPSVVVEVLEDRLEPGSMHEPFSGVDVVVEAFDRAESKSSFIEDVALNLPGVPLVGASGVAGFGNPDRIRTVHAGNLHMAYDKDAPSCDDEVLMASHIALMSAWQADLVIELLLENECEGNGGI